MSDPTLPSIQGYTLTEQLYIGSRVTVYRAVTENNGQSVVIKVLKAPYLSFNELARFHNQFIIAKNLTFLGIVKPLVLIPWNDNSCALVMEDVGGIALRQYLGTDSRLSIEQVMAIALQLADILQHLIQHQILHKAIHPANILIHPGTHQIWLTDFSLASSLPKENQAPQSPAALEGSLAYIAPEQTGRMNRGIDYRADFYSLGVTLYELLTGKRPFQSDDPMELIHCHIAKEPVLPRDVPLPLSSIVLKLMAKNAEDRYQSTLGLKHDLQRCFDQWQTSGHIESFELGQRDRCDRFLIPEKLYGRERAVQTLLEAVERISQGNSELTLVVGPAGVGKTAVVNEVHKPLTRQKGYFIAGKFDQFNRNIPFSAFVQAFRRLMGQLLSESDNALADWKANILAAVGEQGQVLIQVIPELGLIIGAQPAVAELSGLAAQNRFNRLFSQFIQVFTTPDHPLVIFLDDLQWADSASLNLLKVLMAEAKTGYLLVLGAYRDNEVSSTHPLMLALAELQQPLTTIQTIQLKPLQENDIHQLVAESLHCSVDIASPLAKLVYQKTQGNPFFATQFLQGLQADDWITFDLDAGHWQCDLSQIRPLALTHDVVECMVRRFQKWPTTTQNALAIAACLGNEFDLNTLAMVCEQTPEELTQVLWPTLQAGIIVPETETYKFFQGLEESLTTTQLANHTVVVTYHFLHDRVQQAAYAFIPEQQKQQTHYQIGRFLLDHSSEKKQEAYLFDIVNQLNMGRALITHNTDEQYELISLNLRAGIKAKSATAYRVALQYFDLALDILPKDSWQQHYSLTLNLHENTAEAAYLEGDGARMEAMVQAVTTQAKTCLDTVRILQIKMQYCVGQNQALTSIKIARNLLQDLEIVLPDDPTIEDVKQELDAVKQFSDQFSFDEIVALPPLSDPKELAIISTLTLVMSQTMIVAPNLAFLIVLIATRFSLHGNSAYSAYGCSLYALLLKKLEQDIDAAYEWGNLALRLLHTSEAKFLENRIYHTISSFITHGKRHVKETLSVFQQAYTRGLERGDFEFAGYAIFVKCHSLYFIGQELSDVKQALVQASDILSNLRQNLPLSWNQCFYQTALMLSGIGNDGLDNSAAPLAENGFDADRYIQAKQEQSDVFGLFYFYANQTTLLYILGHYSQALEATNLAEQYLAGPAGMLAEVVFYFYDSLTRLACSDGSAPATVLAKVSENQQKMKRWSDDAPMNFRHKYELVCAEEHRLLGDRLAAMDYYDRAIAGAQTNGYLQEQAIANELAAKFYLDWGKEKIAAVYLQEAYACYDRWGAQTKTNDLVNRYAPMLQAILQQPNAVDALETLHNIAPLPLSVHATSSTFQSASDSINTAFDLATIFKSAQALSESLDLNELLNTLSPMMLQTSGAERLVLLLPNANDTWQVRVTATTDDDTIHLGSTPLTESHTLPIQLLQYVQHTQEMVVLDAAAMELQIVDAYLQQHLHRSVLCLPLRHQTQLIGLLYLEHHSAVGVFSSDRITILNFLCTQAAIALENALLNQTLKQKLEDQTAKQQASETRFRNMVDNIPGVIYQVHVAPNGAESFRYVSPNCHALYGVSADTILNGQYSLWDFEYSEDQPSIRQRLVEVNQTLQAFDHQFRIVTPLGTLKWVHVIARPSLKSDGSTLWDGVVMDISDRKTAELALQESQSQFHRMTGNVPGMLYRYVLHSNGSDKLTYVSAQVREIYELEPDIVCQDIAQLWARIHPDDLPWIQELIQESAETLQTFHIEYRVILPQKGLRWVQVMSCVERLNNGDVMWEGIIIDITERKRAEAQLKSVSERLELAVKSAEIGIWEWNGEDNRLSWDQRMFEIYGVPSEAFKETYQDWANRIHPDDLAEYEAGKHLRDQDKATEYTQELRVIRPDGTMRYVLSTAIIERGTHGQPIRMVGMNLDISDRKYYEQQLQDLSERLELAIESAKIGIWKWDRGNDCLTWNERMFDIYGVTLDKFGGTYQDWAKRVVAEDLERVEAEKHYVDNQHNETGYKHEFRIRRPDGQVRYILATALIQRDAQGHPFCSVGTNLDITEQKEAEFALQDAQAQFRRMTENVPGMIYRWILQTNGDQKFIYVSSKVRDLFELEPDDVLQNATLLWERIHPDDVLRLKDTLARNAESGQPCTQEFRLVLPQKGLRWVQINSQPEQMDNGNVVWDGVLVDISARKQAEAEQQRQLTIVESTPDFIGTANPNGKILYLNESWRQLLHSAPAGSPHRTHISEQHPAWALDLILHEALPNAAQQGMWSGETAILDGTGKEIPVSQVVIAHKSSDGNVEYFSTIIRDISDRKRYEQEIIESKAFLQTILDTCPLAIFWKDREGRYISANQNFVQDAGFEKTEDIAGMTDFDMPWSNAETQSFRADDEEVMQSGNPKLKIIQTQINADGTRAWLETNKLPLRDFNDKIIGVLSIYQDISDRKQAELALEQEILRRTTIFNTSSDGIHIVDIQGNLLEANTSFCQKLGYTPAEAKHLKVSDWDAQWSQEEIEARLQMHLSHLSKVRVVETVHRHKDGSIFPVEISICPMEWNQHISFICIARDISERKQAEAQLQRTNEELVRATRLKDEFLANMSHELRTPLNTVIGFSQLMQRDNTLSEKHKQTLNTINRGGEHLLSLINDILQMSKIEAGKTTLDLTTVELPKLLNDLRDMLQIKADSKKLQFYFRYSANIPRYIQADSVKLKQILLNLLSNALKFTQKGQVSFYAKALTSDVNPGASAPNNPKTHLQFSITDTGPGIPKDSQETIFQPFVQAAAGQNTFPGTGLGLPISRKFAQMMEGNIQVHSTVGQGSTFDCNIWVDSLDSSARLEPTPIKSYDGIEGVKDTQDNYRLLVVDDSRDNRELLLQILSLKGLEIELATNGLEAVQKNKSWQPHLIWMDIRMPVMDGLAAVRQIRQAEHQPIIIATTANAFTESREAALAAGYDDFISKPFSTHQVFERVERWLNIELTGTQKQASKVEGPKTKPKSETVVIQAGFRSMPADWQSALLQAVRALKNQEIATLLDEVPEEHHDMVEAIKTLQNNYRFDILVEILKG